MTEKAQDLLKRKMQPDTWMFPPDPDHPVWLRWKEIYGLPTPREFIRRFPQFNISRGWRDAVINHDENYVLMHKYKKACERLKRINDELERSLRIAKSLPAIASTVRASNLQDPFQVVGVGDRGNFQNERIELRALADINLKDFVIYDSNSVSESSISVGNRSAYWFPNQPLGCGNRLILYTRTGTPSDEERNGVIYHFRFRGHSGSLYGSSSSIPVVLRVESWKANKLPG